MIPRYQVSVHVWDETAYDIDHELRDDGDWVRYEDIEEFLVEKQRVREVLALRRANHETHYCDEGCTTDDVLDAIEQELEL
jgi:hypothetical protein